MTDFPTTRISLLVRVKDMQNHSAWEEFAAIYRPVICRFARKRGLAENDAEDLAQDVLTAVAKKLPEWNTDQSQARFRTWLTTVAVNHTITMHRRRKPDTATGGTAANVALQEQPVDESDLRIDYQRELFRTIAREVRRDVEETTWQAFWLTAVEGTTAQDAAKSLGITTGAVYTARSRVIARLKTRTMEGKTEQSEHGNSSETQP